MRLPMFVLDTTRVCFFMLSWIASFIVETRMSFDLLLAVSADAIKNFNLNINTYKFK